MELKEMLYRAGYGKGVLDLVDNVIEGCKECATWKRKLTRPQVKAALSEHFNYRVQTDLFFIFEKTFIALVDECIRWCLVEELSRKTADEWMAVVFKSWIRYFGPMTHLGTDQEGAITSDLVGKCCEMFDIVRDFGGSQGHAAAPIAERRLEIIRTGAQKLWATVQKTGLNTTPSQ
eukprot:5903535-Pyramimonas_sp.AAC.1